MFDGGWMRLWKSCKHISSIRVLMWVLFNLHYHSSVVTYLSVISKKVDGKNEGSSSIGLTRQKS
jgi:hypothetical protein